MTSNIEPLAREMAERICCRIGMSETVIPHWVDLHWPCAAAMLEAGVMDESGEWVPDTDVRLGLAAYRERLSLAKRSGPAGAAPGLPGEKIRPSAEFLADVRTRRRSSPGCPIAASLRGRAWRR